MADDKDIRKIIAGSELRDMADFLPNPENKITDCILCYQTDDEMGYMALGGSSLATLAGLLQIYGDQIRYKADEIINKDGDYHVE